MLHIKYFARLREQLAREEEHLDWQADFTTLADLRRHLMTRQPPWPEALGQSNLLMAVNQILVRPEHPIRDGDEIAFFPPVSGG